MRVAVIGTGYVGLVSGACFSEFGTQVVCVDKDAEKIARLQGGEIPIYEPGLEELVAQNVGSGRLSFTTDLSAAVAEADAVFIAVGTPSRRGDGHADLSFVFAAAEEVARALPAAGTRFTCIVTKSTVPVGTGRRVAEVLARTRPDLVLGRDYDVASNPEFLREGSAIEDFMRPDRVVIGVESDPAREALKALYRPLYLNETPIVSTRLETAELIKYAANAFLAVKITFINEIADLCEQVGGDVQQVARGIGLDGRIGSKFLHAGPGYGGSCFPKDTLALVRTAQEAEAPLRIVETTVEVNEARKLAMAERVVAFLGGQAPEGEAQGSGGPGALAGKTIGLLGLTFKPNTDDMREAPALAIVPHLQAAGASLRAYDPEGMTEAKKLLEGVTWCADPYETAEGADCLVLVTEWNAFRNLDFQRLKQIMAQPALVDLRNVYDPERLQKAGFQYSGIGRGKSVPTAPANLTVVSSRLAG
ncbi:UDP-glucose dehydrogenase family protein [Algihabitans albus]|uniref:UDP-glucose dehydrogenase family protein n=1 Tax=Algihabitans albus TaxID=2164067 RepID=UPI000E5D9328|nr:UDP-glucose/GDP-mannose dehydrogenase family protein [Algihabitans albus]